MAKSWDVWQKELESRLQDQEGKLATKDRDSCLVQAILQRYSKDRPRRVVADVNGNGTANVNVPASYEDGFSRIESLEYPIGDVPPTLLEDDEWQLYRAPSAVQIQFVNARPTASEQFRLTLLARHLDDASTVPDGDFEAVVDYAAALGFELLAARYAKTGDATIAADTVNYRSKAQEFLGLAKAMRRRYFNHLGIDEDAGGDAGAGASLAIGEVDQSVAGSGADRLTHPARWR